MLFNTLLAGAALLSGVTQVAAHGLWEGEVPQSLQGGCNGYYTELDGRPQCADQSKSVSIGDGAEPFSFGLTDSRFKKPNTKIVCPTGGYWWAQPDHANVLFCCAPKPKCRVPPICPPGTEWNGRCCIPCEPTPTPSRKPNKPHWPHWKRNDEQQLSFDAQYCPPPLSACLIDGVDGKSIDCVDTQDDLHNCGGCLSTGKGVDCEKLDGAYRTTCSRGECKIIRCHSGFIAVNGTACVPK